jgi:DNA-binding NtrC family response regulator
MDTRPILVVDDEEEMRKAIEETLHRKGYATVSATNGKEALKRIDEGGLQLVVTDVRMPEMDGMAVLREARKRCPRLPFLLVTAFGTVSQAVEAVKEGAVDYLLKPFTAEELLEKVRSAHAGSPVQKEDHGLVTKNPEMLEILEMARGVARSDVTAVITGESGTGKELLARYIHDNSPRQGRSLVTVNCASIPDTLLESELFGHEKGAFTGASQRRIGKFEMADRSTLLLDEIAEMRTVLQSKLLRVLQEKEVERLGSDRPISVDFRLIATTNRDLQQEVASGRFREDLYYRINVVPIHLPPLRERKQDIPLLVEHFSREVTQRLGMPSKSFSSSALEALQSRPWKGNVRELKNVIERAVVLARPSTLEEADLFLAERSTPSEGGNAFSMPVRGLRAMEKEAILETLKQTGGNRTQTAKILGISVRTLRNKLKEYDYSSGENIADWESLSQ